jgi:ABC-2 type transport system permease protein
MNGRRVAALTRRIVSQFRRDRRTLGLIFVVPIVVLALFGWVIRDQKTATTQLAVAVEDPLAGPILLPALRPIASKEGIALVEVADEQAAREAIRDGRATVAIIVPAGFLAAERAGQSPNLRVLTLGVNPPGEASFVMDAQRVLTVAASSLAQGAVTPPTIERVTVFGSPDADALDTFAPVFVGFFAYFFVFLLTGVAFLRERIGGTLERLLATPIQRGEIVTGYTVGFGLFATLQVTVVMTFALMKVTIPVIDVPIGLDVPCAGNPLLAFLITLVLALGAVSLAIFVSTFARTELQVIQFIPIVIVPQALLSGIIWPVDTLPDVLQPIARLLPLTYAVDGLRDVMIRGYSLAASSVQLDLLVLAGFAILFMVLAGLTIRREVV